MGDGGLLTSVKINTKPQLAASPADFPAYRALSFLIVVILLLSASALLLSTVILFPKRGDITSPESAVVLAGIQASHTGSIYTDLNAYPYTAPAYGPLFYLGVAALARLFRDDFIAVLLAGRAVVLACFLLLGLLVYLCARRLDFSKSLSGLGALAMLSAVDFKFCNVSVRPDVPALALGLLALYLALPEKGSDSWDLVASGISVAAAVLLKQSMIVAGLSIALWLFSRREFRAFAIFSGSAALPVAGTLGILSRHQPVIATMALLRYAYKDVGSGIDLMAHSLAYSMLLLGLGIGGLLFGRGGSGLRLLKIYFVLAWVLPSLMLMQIGADNNYLYEGWSACALLTPAAMDALRASWAALARWSRLALACWVLLGAAFAGLALKTDPVHEYPSAAQLEHLKVLSDISYLSARGSRPELLDPFMNHSISVTGHWSPQPILGKIDGQYYDVVFVHTSDHAIATWRGFGSFDDSILTALSEKYRVLCLANSAAVLLPRDRQPLDVQQASEILNEPCAIAPATSLGSVVQLTPKQSGPSARFGRLLHLVHPHPAGN